MNCLVHLGRYESAKLECEQLLGVDAFSPRERLITLHFFAFSSWKLGRLMPAMWRLEQAAREAVERGADERLADLASTRGQVLSEVASLAEARACLEEACRRYEGLPDPFEACRARVVLGEILLEDGALDEARLALEGALVTAEQGGFHRQQAQIGTFEKAPGDLGCRAVPQTPATAAAAEEVVGCEKKLDMEGLVRESLTRVRVLTALNGSFQEA